MNRIDLVLGIWSAFHRPRGPDLGVTLAANLTHRPWRHRWAGLVLAAAGVLAVSACSSSGSSDASSGSTATSSAAGSGDYNLAAAQQIVAKFTARPTSIGITTPITGSIPKNKTIDLVQCGVPACASAGNYLVSAAQAVGWTVDRINAGLTAESTVAAWNQAVANKPDGVVTSGTPRALFNPELAKLKAAGIPVVDESVDDPAGDGLSLVQLGPSALANTGSNPGVGARIADYMLAQNGGKAFEALAVYTSEYSSEIATLQGFTSTIKSACPKCKVDALNVPLSSIGSDLPTRITTYLTSHPQVKWVWPNYDDFVSGLPQAMQAAGQSGIKLVTWDSSSASISYMQNQQGLVAFDAYPAAEMMWRAIDFFIRSFTGQSTAVDSAVNLPAWVIDKPADIPQGPNGLFPLVADYQAQFKKLWGLG
jgi:ABC-type sugar transport system substrate-binding protein